MAAQRIGGYPKRVNGKWALTDGYGKPFSTDGHRIQCTRITPGAPGSWIDNKRCSYRFKVKGRWYSCRGYGQGIAASCRLMKNPPRGYR